MKIDYVVPMIFDDDPELRQDFRFRFGRPLPKIDRYRSWGTEELLIKCIRKYMTWIDTIHIILARESQRQPWMNQEGINIVYHRDFIPQTYLPVFNSCTIEMFLPFITSVSEYFIYGNDDMFPLSPLMISDFFEGNRPCMHFEKRPWPDTANIFHKKCKWQQKMVASRFNRHEYEWLHGGHSLVPLVKSCCLEAHHQFEEDIINGITPDRSETSYNHYIYTLWQYFSGWTIDRAPAMKYVSTLDNIEYIKKQIRRKDVGVLCINDSGGLCDNAAFMTFVYAVSDSIGRKLTNIK